MTNDTLTLSSYEVEAAIWVARAMSAAVPSRRYAAAALDSYAPNTKKQAAALEAARKFVSLLPHLIPEQRANLWLLGPPGSGKTHLAVGVLHATFRGECDDDCSRPGDHRFVSHVELVREWRQATSKRGGAEESALFKHYSRPNQVLVLDDIRAPRNSDEADALDWLVELRYREECCPTIVTSNLNISDLRQALGDRSFDRLREGALLAVLDGVSHRARFGWDGPAIEQGE